MMYHHMLLLMPHPANGINVGRQGRCLSIADDSCMGPEAGMDQGQQCTWNVSSTENMPKEDDR